MSAPTSLETDLPSFTDAIRLAPPFKTRPDEPYSLRHINPNSAADTTRLKDIDRHPNSTEYIYPGRSLSPREFDTWLRTDSPFPYNRGQDILLAVCDSPDTPPLGWVNIYQPRQLEQVRQHLQLLQPVPAGALIVEVAYDKQFLHWPKGKWFVRQRDDLPDHESSGVAVSGLRQAIDYLASSEFAASQLDGQLPRPIIVTAQTDAENVASEKVLEKNGFTLHPDPINVRPYNSDCHLWVKPVTAQPLA